MPAAAQLGDGRDMAKGRANGATGPEGFVERPPAPPVEQPAARRGLDGPLGVPPGRREPIRRTRLLATFWPRFPPGVHEVLAQLLWTRNNVARSPRQQGGWATLGGRAMDGHGSAVIDRQGT